MSPFEFKVGDFVWLSAEDINLQLSSEKLGDWQLGPYRILEKIGPLDYRLDLPISLDRIHPVIHVDKLYPWKGNTINGEIPPPPEPVYLEDEDEPEYEVEEILDSRVRWKRLEYLVNFPSHTVPTPLIVRLLHCQIPSITDPPDPHHRLLIHLIPIIDY
ncbi:pol-like protein [Lentinula edodes]|uniref:Pol-like protein n=1 Tax=Lentinula edodes TaxID=5353 RepID=A0A1Q3E619_LENED|nr:pol-like protein [Lentinula edodes]